MSMTKSTQEELNEQLVQAAQENELAKVKELVTTGADVNAQDGDGWTALHIAAEDCSLEIAKYLIENGADVNAISTQGYTPLHSAAWHGDLELVKILIESDAILDLRTYNRAWTALHFAARRRHLGIVKILVKSGADINLKDDLGLTALNWAFRYRCSETAEYLKSVSEKGK